MGLRGWLKRLERASEKELITIPQKNGTVERFPQEAVPEAFIALCGGEDHLLLVAARNSSDSWWSQKSAYCHDPASMRDVEDRSE